MRKHTLRSLVMQILLGVGAALLVLCIRPTATQGKPQEQVLYTFTAEQDGGYPLAGLIFDTTGNLYGTTSGGGSGTQCYYGGCGTVFELLPKAGGGWSETVLYTFQGGMDAAYPSAGLIFDISGNLYGTTEYGGSGACNTGISGCGTVFELSPKVGGGWSEVVLYSFQNNGTDGNYPEANLVLDAHGNLYGTTLGGGSGGTGTVFELSPKVGGGWSEAVLYSFQNNGTDGNYPEAGLTFDATGKNLYGTTYDGGIGGCRSGGDVVGCGTAFEVSPKAGGGWSEQVIHNFYDQNNGKDGQNPYGGLVFDVAGNMYGTTTYGGLGGGIVYELSPKAGGWSGKTIFSFNGRDGLEPQGNLILDATGNLYGTSYGGGEYLKRCFPYDCGTVFALLRKPGDKWIEKVFLFNDDDGALPWAGVVFDSAGNLYGATSEGGKYGSGTVFEITP